MKLFRPAATLQSIKHCLITVVEFNLLKLILYCCNKAVSLYFIKHCLITGMKLVNIFLVFYTIRGSVTCSQEPHTDPYPEPYANSSHHPIPLKVLLIVRLYVCTVCVYRMCPPRVFLFSYSDQFLFMNFSSLTCPADLVYFISLT
jgi:hypothetical protein